MAVTGRPWTGVSHHHSLGHRVEPQGSELGGVPRVIGDPGWHGGGMDVLVVGPLSRTANLVPAQSKGAAP